MLEGATQTRGRGSFVRQRDARRQRRVRGRLVFGQRGRLARPVGIAQRPGVDPIDAYRALRGRVDEHEAAAVARGADLRCGAGCEACCHVSLSVSPLEAAVAQHAQAVVLIGRDAPRIRTAIAGCGVPILDAGDMAEAVDLAARRAQPGDAVLLSPACASFDMFKNYAHRAEVFRTAVARLQDNKGAGT